MLTCNQYGKTTFESYIAENGRESGRKDLLTKVVGLKSNTGEAPLTDQEIYTEVSNLILAGTGAFFPVLMKF